jgi:hypothetical protein
MLRRLKLLARAQCVHFQAFDISASAHEAETWLQFRNDAMGRASDSLPPVPDNYIFQPTNKFNPIFPDCRSTVSKFIFLRDVKIRRVS